MITAKSAVALAAALTLAALTGCGAGTALVGVERPPAEVTTAAPISEQSAHDIAARVLADAEQAKTAKGKDAESLRKAALTGVALAVAEADSRMAKAGSATPNPVTKPAAPKVLALSRGKQWPRFMVAESTRDDGTPVLNYLVSGDAKTPFRLAASAAMQPAASVAALDALGKGSELKTDTKGLAGEPPKLLAEYAASLAYPKPKPTNAFAADDPFATSVRRNAAAQAKSLGKLATFTQTHKPLPDHTVAIALRDGGAVVFALLERSDAIELKPTGKSLTPSPEFQRLVGKKTLEDEAELKTYETVVFTVPESGAARLVAVDETLVSAKGA
jgi:hypothetical protein